MLASIFTDNTDLDRPHSTQFRIPSIHSGLSLTPVFTTLSHSVESWLVGGNNWTSEKKFDETRRQYSSILSKMDLRLSFHVFVTPRLEVVAKDLNTIHVDRACCIQYIHVHVWREGD